MVAGASVRITNTGTGISTASLTNASGDFLVPFLVPGSYRISVSKEGFKEFVQDNIPLRVSDRVTINVTLSLGQVTETVLVSGAAPLIETATASMGQVIDTRRISELPLKDGNPVMLANLSPGVLNFTTGGWTMASAVGAPSAIGIDGVRSGNNEFSMDGLPIRSGTSSPTRRPRTRCRSSAFRRPPSTPLKAYTRRSDQPVAEIGNQ